jgi:putative ABC transport system permease protein
MHDVGLDGGGGSGTGLLSGAALWPSRRWLGRPWLLSLRNTFRSQGRLLLTLITLALAGATFISVFSVNASLGRTVDALMGWWNFDVMVVLERPYRVAEIQYTAQQVPGVTGSDSWLQAPVRRVRPDGSESGAIFLFAPRADSELVPAPTLTSGRWLHPADRNAVVVNAIFLQEEPDVQVGDEIVLKVEGEEETFQVVGVSLGILAPMMHAKYEHIARLTGNTRRADTALVATRARDETAIKEITTQLENRFERSGMNVSSVQTVMAERAEAQASFNIIVALLLVMALLLATVGGLGLMGTMSINVLERTREIGVLRAVGAPNRGVALVFIREGMMVGGLSWVLGTVLAVPLSKVLSTAVGVPLMGTPLSFAFSTTGMWVWLGLVLLLSALASLAPARNAARLTVREVLAYE